MQQHQSQLLTEKDGQALAASMIELIQNCEGIDLDVFSVEAQYRDGKPQSNILLEYLKAVKTNGNESVLTGFCSVLTDVLAFPGTDSDLYQRLAQENEFVEA